MQEPVNTNNYKTEVVMIIGTILTVLLIGGILHEMSKSGDTRVKRGKDIFGDSYTKTEGPCYRCDGTGEVNGKTCHKCGGTGWYQKTTWHS